MPNTFQIRILPAKVVAYFLTVFSGSEALEIIRAAPDLGLFERYCP